MFENALTGAPTLYAVEQHGLPLPDTSTNDQQRKREDTRDYSKPLPIPVATLDAETDDQVVVGVTRQLSPDCINIDTLA